MLIFYFLNLMEFSLSANRYLGGLRFRPIVKLLGFMLLLVYNDIVSPSRSYSLRADFSPLL